jgi:hypothetical protein
MLHSDPTFWLPVRLRENLCPFSSRTGHQLILVALHSVSGDSVHNEIVASWARSCAILVGHARRWKCMVIILALKANWKNEFRKALDPLWDVKLCVLAAAKEVCTDKEKSSKRHSVFRILYKACTRTGNMYLGDKLQTKWFDMQRHCIVVVTQAPCGWDLFVPLMGVCCVHENLARNFMNMKDTRHCHK